MIIPTKRVGSKGRLAPWIVRQLPAHNTYVEVFGGTGAVLFDKWPSPREVYNDLDGNLHNLFQVVRDRPDDLARALSLTPSSRRDFETACEYINSGRGPADDPVEWARQYVIFTRQRFIGGGADTWSMTRKGHLPAHTWANLPPEIRKLSERLEKVAIENLDYRSLVAKWDAEDTTFYFDPPYAGVKGEYYAVNKREGFDHQGLRDTIETIKGSSVVSYYKSDEICDLYKGFTMVEQAVTSKVGQEVKRATEALFIRQSPWAKEKGRYTKPDLFAKVMATRDQGQP